MPNISVVMPVCNENKLVLKRAIDSILNQKFKDFEFIIIIDNPHNLEAIELIEEYAVKDLRIKYSLNKSNLGISYSLNKGIHLARAKYIARQDADDESLPERLSKQYKVIISDPSIDVLGTAVRYTDKNQNIIFERFYKEKICNEIKFYNPVAHPTLLIKRELFEKFGYYREQYLCSQDYELWCRWYLKGVHFHNIPEILYKYYQGDNIKNERTKNQLKETIDIKLRFALQLRFFICEYLFLLLEMLLLLLPTHLILALFYKKYKLK